jgi:hypothetical protein
LKVWHMELVPYWGMGMQIGKWLLHMPVDTETKEAHNILIM